MEQHFRHSSFREKLIEHLFVGEILKMAWQAGDCALDVAKPEVDNRGYDLVLERYGVVRHVQLKASRQGGATRFQKVHVALAAKPSGCVVWIEFDEQSLELGPFHFLGAAPGMPLPRIADLRVAKHAKGDSTGLKKERPEIRAVSRSKFATVETLDELVALLFGRVAAADDLGAALTDQFHALITQTLRNYPKATPGSLPALSAPLPHRGSPAWWPVPGMYGGFNYWLDEYDGGPCLIVESWSRVEQGSGERHRLNPEGAVLLDAGFV